MIHLVLVHQLHLSVELFLTDVAPVLHSFGVLNQVLDLLDLENNGDIELVELGHLLLLEVANLLLCFHKLSVDLSRLSGKGLTGLLKLGNSTRDLGLVLVQLQSFVFQLFDFIDLVLFLGETHDVGVIIFVFFILFVVFFLNSIFFIVVAPFRTGNENIYDFDNMRMFKLTKNDQLSKNSLAVDYIVEDVLHSLYGHPLSSCQLNCLSNLAIATLTERLFKFVLDANVPVDKSIRFAAHLF